MRVSVGKILLSSSLALLAIPADQGPLGSWRTHQAGWVDGGGSSDIRTFVATERLPELAAALRVQTNIDQDTLWLDQAGADGGDADQRKLMAATVAASAEAAVVRELTSVVRNKAEELSQRFIGAQGGLPETTVSKPAPGENSVAGLTQPESEAGVAAFAAGSLPAAAEETVAVTPDNPPSAVAAARPTESPEALTSAAQPSATGAPAPPAEAEATVAAAADSGESASEPQAATPANGDAEASDQPAAASETTLTQSPANKPEGRLPREQGAVPATAAAAVGEQESRPRRKRRVAQSSATYLPPSGVGAKSLGGPRKPADDLTSDPAAGAPSASSWAWRPKVLARELSPFAWDNQKSSD